MLILNPILHTVRDNYRGLLKLRTSTALGIY